MIGADGGCCHGLAPVGNGEGSLSFFSCDYPGICRVWQAIRYGCATVSLLLCSDQTGGEKSWTQINAEKRRFFVLVKMRVKGQFSLQRCKEAEKQREVSVPCFFAPLPLCSKKFRHRFDHYKNADFFSGLAFIRLNQRPILCFITLLISTDSLLLRNKNFKPVQYIDKVKNLW
jgi:hypothetical protein